jgi:chromatin assembly factor 1 subunit A
MMEVSHESETQGTKRDHDSFLEGLMPEKPFTADEEFKGYVPEKPFDSQFKEYVPEQEAQITGSEKDEQPMPSAAECWRGQNCDVDLFESVRERFPSPGPDQQQQSVDGELGERGAERVSQDNTPTKSASEKGRSGDGSPTSIQNLREAGPASRMDTLSLAGSAAASPRDSLAGCAPSALGHTRDGTPTSNQKPHSPARSRSSSLSAAGSVTPSRASPVPGSAPSAFAQMNGSTQPPAKKVKLTFAERELEQLNKQIRARERAEAKAKKDAEKAKKEAERLANVADKAQKEAERVEKKRKQDAEKEEKRIAAEEKKAVQEAEKAAKEEKKRQKEEEKRKKDEEKQKAEEDKRKKEKGQKKLNSFFIVPAIARRGSVDEGRTSASPGPSTQESAVPAALTPSKPQLSYYDKTFPAFFVQKHVTLAPINRFERDEQASESIHLTIDSFLGTQSHPVSGHRHDFHAMSIFHLRDQRRRGKRVIPVREIMAEFSGKSTQPIDLTSDSQNSQIKRSIDLLKEVPMKFLKFQEDVRPPYRGTYTSLPIHGIAHLAKNPMRKDLPDKNYDYDSEAEWQEDEDAEDLNSEDEDDEEDDEDDENLKQFLDDENDELAHSKRMIIQGDLEPVSTGLCWEDKHKKSTNVKMVKYRMEVILGMSLLLFDKSMLMIIDGVKSIDPFATKYWPPPPTLRKMEPPRRPLDAVKPPNTQQPPHPLPADGKVSKPPVPTDFFAPASSRPLPSIEQPSTSKATSAAPHHGSKKAKELKPLEGDQLAAFKLAIQEHSDQTKLGLVEILKKRFQDDRAVTADVIRATLERTARREGKRVSEKRWVLIGEEGGVGGEGD